jgi:hypothetical protein
MVSKVSASSKGHLATTAARIVAQEVLVSSGCWVSDLVVTLQVTLATEWLGTAAGEETVVVALPYRTILTTPLGVAKNGW